jgi:hypothetical protein
MRRRPASYEQPIGQPRDLASPNGPRPPTTPSTQADVIEPWLKGGGQTYYLTGWATSETINQPEISAVQLVAAQYIPKGRAGWVKRIMIAPCAPPVLVDPWRGWDGTANYFDPAAAAPYSQAQRAAAQAGLWETPMAWTSYFDAADGGANAPRWQWHLTTINGSLAVNRAAKGSPPFDVTDPTSWYLVPGPAVPVWTYRGALPGRGVNGDIGPQIIQQPPSNPLPCHILVPEDSTVCLWATWTQRPYSPILAFGANGPQDVFPTPPPPVYPLLPSVGSIAGYMQASTREASAENARFGWGA